jgi:hypothetical protein
MNRFDLVRAVAATVGCMVLFAGCGSSSTSTGASSTSTAASTPSTATSTGSASTPATTSPSGSSTTTTTTQRPTPPATKGATRPSTQQTKRFRQVLTSYYECLRQHGVKIPAPNNSGKGPVTSFKGVNISSPQFRTAQKACSAAIRAAVKQLRPTPATPSPASIGPAQRLKFTKYTACMRQQGVNLPAPNFSGKGPIYVNPPNNTTSKFQAASKKCGGLL